MSTRLERALELIEGPVIALILDMKHDLRADLAEDDRRDIEAQADSVLELLASFLGEPT